MKKIMMVFLILCMTVTMLIRPVNVEAANKDACKVTISYKEIGMGKQKATIYGKNKTGKVIWKYKTTTQILADIDKFEFFVNGKYVYIFDYTTLVKVRKKDGKILWKTKKVLPDGRSVCFDKKGNIYMCEYYGTRMYKVSSKGKILWKINFGKTGLYFPYKMKYNKGTVKVYCDASSEDYSIHHFLYVNAVNGKIKKYI